MALSKGPLARAEKIPITPPVLQTSNCSIAAIDFGTSSLSVAYTTPIDGGQIRLAPLYKKHERISNAILITIDHELQQYKIRGIGNRAQSLYSDLEEKAGNFIYFENFLEGVKSLDCTTKVSSLTDGRSYYLIEVIAFILTHLKKKLLTDHLKGDYKSSDFDWVITVPAIWNARARRMMREAAYMAGLTSDAPGITRFTPVGSPLPRPEEVNPEKLSLALGPEVAPTAAQHQSEVVGPPPQRYMVVDIGGGTVDITVHDKSNGKISVVLPPMGNVWGRTTIDEALHYLLLTLLGEIVDDEDFMPLIGSYANNKAALKVVNEKFRDEKQDTRKLVLTLPESFIKHDNIFEKSKKLNMRYSQKAQSITIGYDLLKEKVSQLDKIIECVRAAFDQLTDPIDTVYLVGGFGGCQFVHRKIEEAIRQHRHIPYNNVQPDLAVVTRAVLWRKDPEIIRSRVADATYGVAIRPVFDPSIHDEHYKCVDKDGGQYCRDVFNVFVLKGEEIKDEVCKVTIKPLYQEQTHIIPIYGTLNDGVQYVKDKKGKPTVREIGQLVLNLPNPGNIPNNEREYDLFMDFSGTKIQARAQYSITITGEVKTVCDFLSKQD